MFFFNKKVGFYMNYYNLIFYSHFTSYSDKLTYFSFNSKKKLFFSCLLAYPVLYKKILFLEVNCNMLKKYRMKKRWNINQTLILEGSISSHKCIYTIPIFSLLNYITF